LSAKIHPASRVGNHRDPLPVEPTPVDPLHGAWRNLAREVWERRNPGKSWSEVSARSYAPPRLDGLLAATRLGLRAGGLGAGLGALSALTGARATHPSGIGARGTIEVLPQPELPAHSFFRPGATFPCRIRHGNASFFDDAACVLRGLAIKLADTGDGSPFARLANGGARGPIWSSASFVRVSTAFLTSSPKKQQYEPQARLMDRDPAVLMSWIESVRDAPASYADLTYHGQVAFVYEARDGAPRLCRFRARRPDLEAESGLPSSERQHRVWNMGRDTSDDRPLDYLRAELRSRLASGPVEYVLQIQVREPSASDTLEMFHVNRPWREPWRDLARIRVTEPLTDLETERMRFTPAHMPDGLGIPGALSVEDYRSVLTGRIRIYALAQAARGLRRGVPAPSNPYD